MYNIPRPELIFKGIMDFNIPIIIDQESGQVLKTGKINPILDTTNKGVNPMDNLPQASPASLLPLTMKTTPKQPFDDWYKINKHHLEGKSAIEVEQIIVSSGFSRRWFREKIAKKYGWLPPYQKVYRKIVDPTGGIAAGISETDLLRKHDILFQIQEAVKLLPKGRFFTEAEFKEFAKIHSPQFRSRADLPEFEQYKGKAGSVLYWGHPESIKKFKDRGTFQ